MGAIAIADNIYWVGVKDPGLLHFDIVMETKHGTTYNAYLVRGRDKVALIDTVKAQFTNEFLNNVREITDLESIEYLIVNHTEPDHSGAITALLENAPHITIVCAAAAVPFVKNTINTEARIRPVKDNDVIDLGGKTIIFKSTPYMHWPDTMMEYLKEDGILFSCDGFAGHIAFDSIWADQARQDVDYEIQYYFDSIMRPFTSYIRRNMPKLEALDVRMIAPSHGPIIRRDAPAYIRKYSEWSSDKSDGKNQITIFYVSSYGNTALIAQTLASRLSERGFTVVLIDTFQMDESYARDQIEASVALLFGTPTFNGDAVRPIWNAVSLLSTVNSVGKKAAVFGSYGWGGEGTKLVSERLAGLRLKIFSEALRARLIPSQEELAEVASFAGKIADFVESV
ncbi:MAG TPA: FprA family A-type flavoprotein [Candidatus Deferrimicrobium sp.]|nr:FprA family A-type flavoprotein [Candidatus Deferrimicrobium sp.]